MTVLEENHHSFLIIEHDPMLYEDAKEMVEYVAQGPEADLQGGDHPALLTCVRPSPGEDDRTGRPSVLLL